MKHAESWSNLNQRARDSGRKTWRDWHEINPWLFPLPSELAQDPGPVGVFLSRVPDELLRDADRCPDPWADLCANQFIPCGFHSLFRACAGVLPAAISLAHAVYSRGDLVERVKRGGSEGECEGVIRKLFPGMWRAAAGLLREGAAQEGPELLREFEEREARLLKIIAKKSGKAAAAARPDKPTAEAIRCGSPVRYLLLVSWLRCGHLGDPGLCFYSDPALVALLSLLGWPHYNTHLIERMRERLGLLKACPKIPYVTGVRMNPRKKAIELNTLDATKAVRFEWPPKPRQMRCRIELNGRVLYGGIPS
jgi:hypothetical protein